jgi:hypothetical protein
MNADILNQRYLDRLRHFDRAAVRRKRAYQAVWMVIIVLTWLTLLLAIAGLAFPEQEWFRRVVLQWLIPAAGSAVTVLTVLQTTLGLRGRWLRYRAAAERLRRACMLYRAGVPPFAGAGAADELARHIEEVGVVADRGKGKEFHERFEWNYFFDLLALPPELRNSYPHTPDEGLAPGLDDRAVLDGRLQHQRQWYVRKSRQNLLRFLGFQFAILAISLFNTLYVFFFGRAFVLVAVTTTVSLGLIACRDFLDCGMLFVRYLQAAGNLKEIEQAFHRREPPFREGDGPERLRRLVEQVEQTIASEFQFWYATR